MSSNRSDRIYSNLRNEFLRFNDLKPSSKPLPFWILFLAFSAALLVPLIISNLLPESADLAVRIFAATYLAFSAFLLIPGTALFLRRYADLSIFQTLLQRFADFQRRNLIGARVAKIAGWLLLGSIVLFAAWVNAGITALALIILAAFPTSSAPLEQPKSKVMPSAPTLPMLNQPIQPVPPLTPATFVAPNPTAAYRAELVSPSKELTSRAGFWVSLAFALIAFFMVMFPNVMNYFEAPIPLDGLEETVSPSPSTLPEEMPETPTPAATSPPVTQPTETLVPAGADNSGGAASDDAGVAVLPLNSEEDGLDVDLLDPRFRYCTHAIGAGYGPYYAGIDPEYEWYFDRDGDGIVCER